MSKLKVITAISLISGGIDSPIAAHIIMNEGLRIGVEVNVVFLHLRTKKFGDPREIEKVRELIKKLSSIHKKRFKLYIVPYDAFHEKTMRTGKSKYHCIICKRTMLRIAEEIGRREGASFIITGENLGQVASQTLSNMKVIDSAVKLPVLKPLLVLDKEETMSIAKKIGTYEISIIRTQGCKALPKRPATKSELHRIEEEEEKLGVRDIINELLKYKKLDR